MFQALEPAELAEFLAGAEPLHPLQEKKKDTLTVSFFGADYGARTRHLHLGKVALYQMS